MRTTKLFGEHPLAFQTQYQEVADRALAIATMLPGTPGHLKLKVVKPGHEYWYRIYYATPGRKVEELVCAAHDAAKYQEAKDALEFHGWLETQVSNLRRLNYQVADKGTARVLVELYNRGAFEAGLVLVGTLAYMAWLNQLGIHAVAARTLDIDIARRQQLKLAAPLSFLKAMQATTLPFVAVPGMPSWTPSTSVKLPGADGLRVDVLAPGKMLGTTIKVSELEWAAQGIPFYDYVLEAPVLGLALAGGHAIPVRLPQCGRFALHKLYSSLHRPLVERAKAEKDWHQGIMLLAAIEQADGGFTRAWSEAPKALKTELRPLKPKLIAAFSSVPEAAEAAAALR